MYKDVKGLITVFVFKNQIKKRFPTPYTTIFFFIFEAVTNTKINKMAAMRNRDYALLLTRLIFGGLMLSHGWPKLMKIVNSDWGFADPLGLGPVPSLILTVFAEFFCAASLVLGFKTRWCAIPLIFTMFVAAFIVHGSDPLGDKEHALLFLGGFVVLALMGGGRISIDGK